MVALPVLALALPLLVEGHGHGANFCLSNGAGPLPVRCPCQGVGAVDHGCPNSEHPGGAGLAIVGALPTNEPVVGVDGLPAGVSCVFVQGSAALLPGVPFGDGLRCIGGTLLRLAVKPESGGTATYPEGSDLSIYARSAELGDWIPPGASRHYQAVYGEPSPTFCPGPTGGPRNATNGLSLVW